MKKIIALVLCLVSVVGFTVGCQSKAEVEGPKEVNVAAADILEDMKNVIAEDLKEGGVETPIVEGNLMGYMVTDLTAEESQGDLEAMGMDASLIEEGYALQAMINIRSDKMFVIKAKDEASVEGILEGLEKVKTNQENIWSQYLVEQYEKVQNNITKSNGQYILYVTYDDPAAIEAVFDNALKQ